MTKQDYSYSLDSEAKLIHIVHAVKGNEYYCPSCGNIMIPRQGRKKRWHFAHKVNLENCSYETYLHKIAKRKIRECFNESLEFIITFPLKFKCKVEKCPIESSLKCSWKTQKEYNLKKYYDTCEEEKEIGKFRADLLISDSKGKHQPILIEIYVTHKSTNEKLNSGYRIIEIPIKSEDDIKFIIDNALINETEPLPSSKKNSLNIIQFHNFPPVFKLPNQYQQRNKYQFWIDTEKNYHFDTVKCLYTPSEKNQPIFLLSSRYKINKMFAFYKLAECNLGIKYCKMCQYYKENAYLGRFICILYKTYNTPKFPNYKEALTCPYYKQVDFLKLETYQTED